MNEVFKMFLNIVYSLIAQVIVSIVSFILFIAYYTGGVTSNASFGIVVCVVLTGFSLLLLFVSGMLLNNQGAKLNNLISVSVVSFILIIAWILRCDDGGYIVLNLPFFPLFYVLSENKIAGLVFTLIPSLMLWMGLEHKNKNNK